MSKLFISATVFVMLCSCSSEDKTISHNQSDTEKDKGHLNNHTEDYYLVDAEYEAHICDSLGIDETLIAEIRELSDGKIEPFHYSLSKMYEDGESYEIDPIRLNGLVIYESNVNSYELVFKLKDDFRALGYSIFLLENNYGIGDEPDMIGVLKTTNKLDVLDQIQTDGINYDIDNDSLKSIIHEFDLKYDLELIGASGDWCEFIIHGKPTDWMSFAEEVYEVCPDVVDQGTGSVEALAESLETTGTLYFWWD